ncbi:MAG TPA: cellulase family glycosylhydrolase [Luteolibacter sp.]|nr:cellulase family glycosylhydrolase [Luteolibacter sp.]
MTVISRRLLLAAWLLAPLTAPAGPAAHFIPDEYGRELVPGGFVAITEDRKGRISYTPDDYRRMVRMGANFQVIRLSLGRLGGWPGTKPDPAYPAQIDDMVRMGREAGLRTVFKLVVYGIKGFGPEQWDALWKNTDGSQDALLEAWRKIWTRYRDDPSVFGYDLLNEPQRGLEPGEQRCVREDLLPTLRRLTDAMQEVSPDKWALYQPLFRHKGQGVGPFAPMPEPLGRDRVIYAPHMYTTDIDRMRETLDRYEREAALSKAPLMLGEWGPSVALTVDSDPKRQAFYTKVYQLTARDLDRRGIGGIKAWFCGSRSPLENKKTSTKYTWAIFSDTRPVGRVERKYLVDPLARPRPLAVAGRLEGFGFNFNAQTLEINLRPDATLGATEVFISADRYYPAGFRVEIGDGLVMALKPGDKQLSVVHSATASDRSQAPWVRWDADKLRLVIEKWTGTAPRMALKIVPLADSNPPPGASH